MGAWDRMKQAAEKERKSPTTQQETTQSSWNRMKQAAEAETARATERADERDKQNVPSDTRLRQAAQEMYQNPLAPGGRNPSVAAPQRSTPWYDRYNFDDYTVARNVQDEQKRKEAWENSTVRNVGRNIGAETASNITDLAGIFQDIDSGYNAPQTQRSIDEGRPYKTPEERQRDALELYELSDRLAAAADEAQRNALEGKGAIGQTAVRGAMLLGNIVAQVGANMLVPGSGAILRAMDVAGRAGRAYRQRAGEDYDAGKAALASVLSAGGVALGGKLSGVVGAKGLEQLALGGNLGNLAGRVGVGAASGLAFAAGEIPLSEIGNYLADPTYSADAKDILKRTASAVAFGAINQLFSGLAYRYSGQGTVSDPQREMKWFNKDMSAEEAAQLHRSLAKRYHPDAGGDAAIMQEINDEYSYFLQHFANRAQAAYTEAAQAAANGDAEAYETASAEYRQAIGFLMEAVNDGAITGKAASAIGALATISETGIPAEQVAPPATALAARPTLAQVEPVEPPASNLTPEGIKPVDAQETPEKQEAIAPKQEAPVEKTEVKTPQIIAKTIPDTEIQQRNSDIVKSYGDKQLGKNGAETLTGFYNGEDTTAYIKGMTAYYNAGKNGAEFESVTAETSLTDPQKRAAFIAGQADANLETRKTEDAPLQERPRQNTITTKKSDWPAHDVEWTVPGKKKPIAYSTVATSDSIGAMADEHPDASISELVQYFNYGPDEKNVLQQYINAGYGDQNAREWFSYDARHGIRPTAPYNNQGVKSWEDVIDSGRVSSMTKSELNAVKDIFEKPKTEQKQTYVSATAEKTAETEPIESKPAKNGDKASNPQQQIADAVRRSLDKGIAFNSARLFEIADKAFGGTMAEGKYTVKDAYDGMELAVNQYLMNNRPIRESANGDVLAAQRALTQLQDLLAKLPTQTKRSAEQESYQQFSTPPNIAYLAAWAANVSKSDVVLEPSAGIGGLALWPKAWGATVYGNELSKRRLAFLDKLGLDGTFNLNAEQINNLLPDGIKPTVVLMNPPFSATAGRTATNNTENAKRHIEQALDRLEDGGRLVAILGNGMSDDARAFRSWWNDLRKENSIRANIRIDGENYKKYGTTFDVQLVVIDKTGAQTGETITGEYKDLSEVLNLLEGIRNDRDIAKFERNAAVAGVQKAPERPVTEQPVSSASAEIGAGGESAGLDEQHKPAGAGILAGNERGSGRSDVSNRAENGVSDADNKQQSGRRGNKRRVASGGNEEVGRSSVDTAGRSDGQSGSKRIELEQRPSDAGLKQAAKDAAENPDSIYSTYVPRKARIKGSKPHPAKLVESAAMAAVEPPDVTYTPNLPENVVKDGILSDAQLENVIYAGQAHGQKLPNGTRKGFFIGDGTGVGKGRQIAGIIMDNFRQGRGKALWISEKAALVNDAQRDWTALGGKADDVIDIKKIKYKKGEKIKADSGILFSSYDTLKTDKGARLRMLKDWLGEDFDGVIALDEAHNMGNANGKKGVRGKTKPSAKALAGIDLQNAFPNARVVYASATGATEASNYAYLQRLGLWGKGTAFHDFNDFMSKISNGGLAAMELVARDMKAMGEYMARSISYDDVTYDELTHELTPMQTEIYNTMSKAWQKVMQNVNKALEVTGQAKDGMARGRAMSAIFGTQQRFYNQILTSMSMPSVIEDMKRELANGRSCVLQLVNTNAAAAERAIAKNAEEGGDLDDLDLTPSDMLIEMVQHSFPVELYEPYTDEEGRDRSRPVLDAEGKPVIDKKAVKMRDALIDELRMMKVPDGPLEMLFDAFGVENVAEVTGRTRRVVEKKDETGARKRVIENRTNNSGIADANMFQDGKKRILVFSDAGGTGRSYHADLTAKNQQQRVHYLLQPGWEASKAVQGFGRTHRSNQASAPIFRLITTNVMGQKRFTSTIARRLDQLGALTKGQRQAGSGVFGEKDNLENPIAEDALSRYYRTVDPALLKKLGLYDKIYDEWGRFNDKSEALRDIGKFLNRILSLEVDEQNRVFQGFYDTFDRFMDIAIANGTVDMGLENYRADKIDVVDEKTVRKDPTGADTKYVQMTAYRKPEITPFNKVKDAHQNFQGIVRTEDGSVRAVYEISSKTNPKTGEIQRRFKLESPVNGKSSTYVEETLKAQTKPIEKADWKEAWEDEIAKAPEYNTSTLHLLTGTLLPIWDRLPQDNTRVMRVMSSDGRQYLGRVIRPDQIDSVLRGLGANRTVKHYTGSEVQTNVMQGKEAAFERDRLKLIRRRVSGEWRMELTGPNVWFIARQYSGLITEKINYQPRYFVPTGESGNKVLDEIMKHNPVIDIHDAAPETVDESRSVKTDHSDQWTADRIKGGEVKEASSLSEIINKIQHDFGINVTTGHIRGSGVRGQYNRNDQGVRTKIANDLPTAAHELGHHLDNVYGLRDHLSPEIIRELENGLSDEMRAAYPNQRKWKTEGIAEYFRKYLQNRETAVIDYPYFTAYWKGLVTGRDAAMIDQLADEVNAYYSLDADTATSSIRRKEQAGADFRTTGEKIHEASDRWYQHWVDSNHAIDRFAREMGDDQTYKLATNAAYSDAMSGAILAGDLYNADGKYVSPGLKTALNGINLKSKEYDLFGEYLVVKHGPERLAEGMRIFADDRKNSTAWMNRRQAELEAEHPQFKEASERLYDFRHDFYEAWGVDTGLISQETLDEWEERWDFYMPLNRAIDTYARGTGAKRGFANQTSTIKRAHGSGLDIINPVDNLIDNIVLMVNAGTRNNVMRSLTDAALNDGNALWMEKVPMPVKKKTFDMTGVKAQLSDALDEINMTAASKAEMQDVIANISDILEQYGRGKAFGNVVTVLKNGKPEYWKVNDPLLLESLVKFDTGKSNKVVEGYKAISRFMTACITGNDVLWSVFSNFPRDLQTLMTYSPDKNHPLALFRELGSAYVNRFRSYENTDPIYKEYLAMGGGQTSVYTSDRNLAKRARDKFTGSKMGWLNPLEWLSFISETVESGPRYATYKLCRLRGMTPQEAIYASHEITVNFRRGGTIGRDVNGFVLYFNAAVQGADKFNRYFTADDAPPEQRKKVAAGRIMAYIASQAILGTLMYALNNRDDESRENYQQLSNYTKNSYWLFPMGDGKYFAIPKARELSVPASLFESLAEYFHGGNEKAFDGFWSYATDNYAPPVVSDVLAIPDDGANALWGALASAGIAGVIGTTMANKDYLGRPIESAGMQYLEPGDRYNQRTSTLAKLFADGMRTVSGGSVDLSPQMLDYFFQQTLGGFWKVQKALFPVGSENRDLTLGLQGRFIKDNQYSTDLVNWLYDKADESSMASKSDPSDMGKKITAAMDSRMTSFYSTYNKLAKNNTEAERGTRQVVLNMIKEYQKNDDLGDIPGTERLVYQTVVADGQTDLLPSTMKSTVKDARKKEHQLTDVQYVEYQVDYNRLYWLYAGQELKNVKKAEDRIPKLREAKAKAKEEATNRALNRIGAPT